ncbi:MAG TPA: glutathione peroxidase [Candidatus Limiplasma sp.]|nr:glutathione peroxidase [Candidatus Limiplasma sp.]
MTLYDITVLDRSEQEVSLKDYQGKVLLIVNTATKCGHTPQYNGLEALYEKYRGQGFEILDFPCNQFAGQAPGTNEEIHQFCTLNFGTTFPRFAKVNVNGKEASPLFTYLKEQQKGEGTGRIKWNFTKFLVDREGNVVKRFEPKDEPEEMEADIRALL